MTLLIKTDLSEYSFFNKLLALVSLLCMLKSVFLKMLLENYLLKFFISSDWFSWKDLMNIIFYEKITINFHLSVQSTNCLDAEDIKMK